jgi:hypothetical protein
VVHEQRTTELDKAFVYTYYGCMGKLPNTLKLSQHLTPKQKKFAEVMVAKWGQITKAEAVREAGYEPKRDNGASELGSKLTNPNKNPHVVRYIEKLRAAETFKWEKDKLSNRPLARCYQNLYQTIKSKLKNVHFTRIESSTQNGIPDVNACKNGSECWLELARCYQNLYGFRCPCFRDLGQRTTNSRSRS